MPNEIVAYVTQNPDAFLQTMFYPLTTVFILLLLSNLAGYLITGRKIVGGLVLMAIMGAIFFFALPNIIIISGG